METILESLTGDESMAYSAYRGTAWASLPDRQRDIITSLASRYPQELFGGVRLPPSSPSTAVSQMSTNSLPSTPGMLSSRQFQRWEARHGHGHGHDADSVVHDDDMHGNMDPEAERTVSEGHSIPLSRRDAWSVPSTPGRLSKSTFHEWEARHGGGLNQLQHQHQHQHQPPPQLLPPSQPQPRPQPQFQSQRQDRQVRGLAQIPTSLPPPVMTLSLGAQSQQKQPHQQKVASTNPFRAAFTASTVANGRSGTSHQDEDPFLSRNPHTGSPRAADMTPRASPATPTRTFPPQHPDPSGSGVGAGSGAALPSSSSLFGMADSNNKSALVARLHQELQAEVDALELARINWADAMHRAVDLEQEQERRLAKCELLHRRLEYAQSRVDEQQ